MPLEIRKAWKIDIGQELVPDINMEGLDSGRRYTVAGKYTDDDNEPGFFLIGEDGNVNKAPYNCVSVPPLEETKKRP